MQILAKKLSISQKVVGTASTFFRRLYYKLEIMNLEKQYKVLISIYLGKHFMNIIQNYILLDVCIYLVN